MVAAYHTSGAGDPSVLVTASCPRSSTDSVRDAALSRLPTLVLLPGLDGTGILFEPLARALGVDLDVRVVRYPSDPTLGYRELESLARAALPTDRPFVILGESFSGPIAIRLAADSPPGLVGLILVVTFARNPYPLLA